MEENDLTLERAVEKQDSVEIRVQKVEEVEGCLILHLKGYIDTYATPYFKQQVLNRAVAAGFTKLIFDCEQITYVASTPIAELVNLMKQMKSRGGDVFVINLRPKVADVFDSLGLTSFFHTEESLESSIDFFLSQVGGVSRKSLFPRTHDCPICGKRVKVTQAGRFRCPGCKTILRVTEEGHVLSGLLWTKEELDLIPDKTQKALDLLNELALQIRQDKETIDELLNQIVLNIYQREVKDVWAELVEVPA